MADSASIGSSFSSYSGDPFLGGANIGKIDIDTRPLSQLASYTYYYKRDKWNQLQKETDAKIAKLADISSIALNDLYGKDKEQMIPEFAQLQKDGAEYIAKTPKTAQERLQNELDWQTKYGAFLNKFNSGKARAVTYHKLINDANTTVSSGKSKDELLKRIENKFNSTDISTPISAMEEFPVQKFEIAEPVTSEFESEVVADNFIYHNKGEYYDPTTNSPRADASILNIRTKSLPQKGTDAYNNLSPLEKEEANSQSDNQSEGKILIDMTVPFNQALANYRKDGKFNAEAFETENASNGTLMKPYNALKRYGEYSLDHYNRAKAGEFNDKNTGVKLPTSVIADRFKPGFIDFSKDITPNQLAQSAMLAKFGDDKFEKKATPTGDANEMARANLQAATTRRGQDLNFREKELDLIGKGWAKDAKGKLQPPKRNALTSDSNGGIVPYWQNYITPQINAATNRISTVTGVPVNKLKELSGDVEINASDFSGLGLALLGETTAEGKPRTIIGADATTTDKSGSEKTITRTKIKIRFDNGNPIGVVIDDVFYDANDVNSKATRLQDKTVTNKLDAPIYETNTEQAPLSDAQKYLNSLK